MSLIGAMYQSEKVSGKIECVQIMPRTGGECRLRHPGPGAMVTLHRDSSRAEDLTGDVLTFPARQGEIVVVDPGDRCRQV